jgi:hypothetical protein
MAFPIPIANTSESQDSQRDERKRQSSPPSSFFAQSQAILTSVNYIEPLHSGYVGAAAKHKNRTRSALLVQMMSAFEFAMKDFIAQTLDATHLYDDVAKEWKWLLIDIPSVMSSRDSLGRVGAILIHPLLGWQTPETMNSRYQDVYGRQPIAKNELQQLRDLWIIRHSIAHNGGFVTEADARRLRTPALRNRQILIDVDYLQRAVEFLRGITMRLSDPVGLSLLRRWFAEGAAGTWDEDRETYQRLKKLVAYVNSRVQEVPVPDQAMYIADQANFAPH